MRTHHIQNTRNDVPQWVLDCRNKPWNFTMDFWGYHTDEIVVPPIRWSYNARFATFYHGHPRYFNGVPHIRFVSRKPYWSTYKKKTAGMYAEGIKCPNKVVRLEISMVHEFTHAVQFYEKTKLHKDRPMSEVETTKAEIAYVRSHYPTLYDQLETFE